MDGCDIVLCFILSTSTLPALIGHANYIPLFRCNEVKVKDTGLLIRFTLSPFKQLSNIAQSVPSLKKRLK